MRDNSLKGTTSATMKRCTKCGQEFPTTKEYFHADKSKRDGLRVVCKACHCAANVRYRVNNLDKVMARDQNYRTRNAQKRRDYSQRYYAEHTDQVKERVRQWNEVNPGAALLRRRMWGIENPEKQSIGRRISSNERRARILSAKGTYTAADIAAQLKRQKGRCYYMACGHSRLGDDYHIDHVMPLVRNGRNAPDNLVLSCPSCNLKKGKKLPHEWVEGGRLL